MPRAFSRYCHLRAAAARIQAQGTWGKVECGELGCSIAEARAVTSRGQRVGLRLVGGIFRRIRLARRFLRAFRWLRAMLGLEHARYPVGAFGQSFGLAGNVALLELGQPDDVRRRELR